MSSVEPVKPWRRKGINVGDVVRIREKHVEQYAKVWAGVTHDEALTVVFRHQVQGGVGSYWCHLKWGERTILAKPSHLTIAKKNPALREHIPPCRWCQGEHKAAECPAVKATKDLTREHA